MNLVARPDAPRKPRALARGFSCLNTRDRPNCQGRLAEVGVGAAETGSTSALARVGGPTAAPRSAMGVLHRPVRQLKNQVTDRKDCARKRKSLVLSNEAFSLMAETAPAALTLPPKGADQRCTVTLRRRDAAVAPSTATPISDRAAGSGTPPGPGGEEVAAATESSLK